MDDKKKEDAEKAKKLKEEGMKAMKKANIINHIAYKVKNLNQTITYIRKKNCAPITQPMLAEAFKKKVIFFLTPLNFIIELIEE